MNSRRNLGNCLLMYLSLERAVGHENMSLRHAGIPVEPQGISSQGGDGEKPEAGSSALLKY